MLRRRGTRVQFPTEEMTRVAAAATARRLFKRRPLHARTRISEGSALHIVVAGFAALGQAIALQFMYLAHYGTPRGRITILDDDHARRAAEFLHAYPQAESICKVVFADLRRAVIDSDLPVNSVYVCLESRADAIRVSAALRESCARSGASPAIFLHLDTFEPSTDVRDWDGQTFPFCTAGSDDPEAAGDELAEILHQYYRDSIVGQGQDLGATPAGRPWSSLDESYREASRHQVDHMEAKLAVVGCRSVPEERAEFFTFSQLEVERLARIEHRRWCADRFLGGWIYGPTRDNQRKIHPQLVPYEELSKAMKDLDRYAVRLIPVLFARYAHSIARDLEIGVAGSALNSFPEHRLKQQINQTLERLTARAPDRIPVVLTSLNTHAERLMASVALDQYGTALRVLLPGPIDEILGGLDTDEDRRSYLQLLARAEHRSTLGDEAALQDFIADVPEVLVTIGRTDGARDDVLRKIIKRRERLAAERRPRVGAKIVRLEPRGGAIEWSFEY